MRTMTFARCVKYLLPIALLSVSAFALGQQLSLTVDDPRPLAAVTLSLETQFGWIVTYEDPRYPNPNDSKDVTAAVRRTYAPGQGRILVPLGGTFTFVAPAEISSPATDESDVLTALLQQYEASGFPGSFALRRTGSAFHIIPTRMRAANGAQQIYTPPLDMPVFQASGERTAMDAVRALVAQTNGQLALGRVPTNLFQQTNLSQEAANVKARSMLVAILNATNKPLSWQVLCDPGDTFPCVLNIHIVEPVLRGR